MHERDCHGSTRQPRGVSLARRRYLGRRTLDARSVRRHLGDRSNRNCLNDTLLIGRAGVLHHLSGVSHLWQ